MGKFDLAAVVVTYKTKVLLEGCLTSFYQELSASKITGDIIVIDNASNDGTLEMTANKFPTALVIGNTENYGPAKAFNQGLTKAIQLSDIVLILNSDIEILPGTLKTMYDYLQKNPDVAGVNGSLLNHDGSRQLIKTHIWNLNKPDLTKSFPIEFVGTTFAMIRAEVYRKIGGYDENYYFYNEDLDWAERAKRARIRFMYLPEAKVIHFLSKGSNQNRSRITRELYWSNIYYYKKFYPSLAWLAFIFLKADLNRKTRELQKKLNTTKNPEEVSQLKKSINDLEYSRGRMLEEYRTVRPSRVPFWE